MSSPPLIRHTLITSCVHHSIDDCDRFAAIAQAAQSTDSDSSGGVGGNSSGGIGVNSSGTIGVTSNNNSADRSIDIVLGGSGSGSGSSIGVSPVTVNLLPYQHKQREAAQLAAIAQVLPAPAPSSPCLYAC